MQWFDAQSSSVFQSDSLAILNRAIKFPACVAALHKLEVESILEDGLFLIYIFIVYASHEGPPRLAQEWVIVFGTFVRIKGDVYLFFECTLMRQHKAALFLGTPQ